MIKKIFIITILMLFGCSEKDSNSNSVSVTGVVKTSAGVVENASVSLNDLIQYTVTTDENGYFNIDNVNQGEYNLNIKKTIEGGSYSSRTDTVIVFDNDINLNDITLPEPVTLSVSQIESTIEGNTVTLTWDTYDGDDFREYKLYRNNTSGLDENTGELVHVTTSVSENEFSLQLPHNSTTYFRLFILDDLGLLGGSNVVEVVLDNFVNQEQIELNTVNEYFLNENEEQTLYFDAQEGSVYAIQWFDSWFDDYTANSIVVSSHNENETNYYFENERLIQMDGSPMPLIAESSERVYLKIKGFTNTISGTYGVKITELTSVNYSTNTDYSIAIDLGETKLIDFNAEIDKEYKISLISTVPLISIAGDAIETHVSIFEEQSSTFLNYKDTIANICCNEISEYFFNVDSNKKIYIILDGAYWFISNNIDLSIEEI